MIEQQAPTTLEELGEAIFADWYPDWREGDPILTEPPAHLVAEAETIVSGAPAPIVRQRPNLRLVVSR